MKDYFFNLLSDLETRISALKNENLSKLMFVEKVITLLLRVREGLKNYTRDYAFESIEEEINFFKHLKPILCGKLLFYKAIWQIESLRPQGNKETIKQYLIKQMDVIYDFYENHKFIYQYHVTDATYLDEIFFMRGKCPQLVLENEDDFFITLCDMKFAEILGNELLLEYLQNEINSLDNIKTLPLSSNLKWVFPKRALVQLIYALYAKHCFGEKATIRDITNWLECSLNIDLKDVYHTYKDFKERTMNPVNFLEELQSALLKKIEEDENND